MKQIGKKGLLSKPKLLCFSNTPIHKSRKCRLQFYRGGDKDHVQRWCRDALGSWEEKQALNTRSFCKVSSLYSSENVCSTGFIWYK